MRDVAVPVLLRGGGQDHGRQEPRGHASMPAFLAATPPAIGLPRRWARAIETVSGQDAHNDEKSRRSVWRGMQSKAHERFFAAESRRGTALALHRQRLETPVTLTRKVKRPRGT